MTKLNWQHKCSMEWLQARKTVLTATEMCDLRSKRAAARRLLDNGEVHPDFAYLWEEKHSTGQLNPWSPSSDAARGHCLEPYAVAEINEAMPLERFYHWDDCIIVNDGIGFSPDATNVDQNLVACHVIEQAKENTGIRTIAEIKCYGIKKHAQTIYTKPSLRSERYQIAAAMLVAPSIEVGYLVLYNPNAYRSLDIQLYTRKDLEKEIKELEETVACWKDTCKLIEEYYCNLGHQAMYTEEFIYNEVIKEWI